MLNFGSIYMVKPKIQFVAEVQDNIPTYKSEPVLSDALKTQLDLCIPIHKILSLFYRFADDKGIITQIVQINDLNYAINTTSRCCPSIKKKKKDLKMYNLTR